MHWYGGSIAEAVSLSKQRNAIFVVFVEGENELSTEMAATIDNSVVVSRLADQSNFLAIKLKSGSTNYTHFAQIYQFVPVPSLFFIGRNGTPLEVVCAGVPPDNLATRIDKILEEHSKEKLSPIQPSTSIQHLREQTESLLQSEAAANIPPSQLTPDATPEKKAEPPKEMEPESSGPSAAKTEHHEVTKSGQEYDVVCDGDVCVRRPRGNDQPGPSQLPTVPVATVQESTAKEVQLASVKKADTTPAQSLENEDDKVERAKELIEARKREKAELEKEKEKQKELERRAVGQGVTELKRWQEEQELKQIQEDRKREKLEKNLARQRILEQIAQDRAERKARDAPLPPAPVQQQPTPATSGDGGSRARLQLKLPDGSSHTAHFRAEDTLLTVHQYIADNLQMPPSSFSLWTAFPRRELTATEETLANLGLAPSAALLVLPCRTAAVVANPSAIAAVITYFTQFLTTFILEPSQNFFTWLRNRLFPAPPPPPRHSPPPSPSPPPTRPPPGVRRRGNVHRLPDDRSGDDDNNTWNGNSTQQM